MKHSETVPILKVIFETIRTIIILTYSSSCNFKEQHALMIIFQTSSVHHHIVWFYFVNKTKNIFTFLIKGQKAL